MAAPGVWEELLECCNSLRNNAAVKNFLESDITFPGNDFHFNFTAASVRRLPFPFSFHLIEEVFFCCSREYAVHFPSRVLLQNTTWCVLQCAGRGAEPPTCTVKQMQHLRKPHLCVHSSDLAHHALHVFWRCEQQASSQRALRRPPQAFHSPDGKKKLNKQTSHWRSFVTTFTLPCSFFSKGKTIPSSKPPPYLLLNNYILLKITILISIISPHVKYIKCIIVWYLDKLFHPGYFSPSIFVR